MEFEGNEGAVATGGVPLKAFRLRAWVPAAVDGLDANVDPCGTWAHLTWPVDRVVALAAGVRQCTGFRTFPCHPLALFGHKIGIV